MGMVAWGRDLMLALPCVRLRWIIASSALEMKDSTCMVGSSSEFCCEAHFSGRFPDLHITPAQLGRVVTVSSK